MRKIFLSILPISILALTSCEKETVEPTVPNEEEVITTLILDLENHNNQKKHRFIFQDLDGDGGNAPQITLDTLETNTTYQANIILLNETETPADSISNEVLEEGDHHQFFFKSTDNKITVEYADKDEDNFPIGLKNTLKTTETGKFNLNISLKHKPIKTAAGVKDGDPTNAGGETDIEVNFEIPVL